MRKDIFTLTDDDAEMLRGAAILFVLVGHAGEFVFGGTAGVVIFLMLSGYGLSESFRRHGLHGFWGRRIKKVYLPYLFMAVLQILASRPWVIGKIAVTLIGLDFDLNYDPTMWYISFTFLCYALFYIAAVICARLRTRSRLKYVFIAVYMAASVVGLRFICLSPAFHESTGAVHYIFAFPLGVMMSLLGASPLEARLREHRCFIIAAVAALCLAYQMRYYCSDYDALYAMSLAGIAVAAIKLLTVPEKLRRLLNRLARYSYPIYLVEGFVLYRSPLWFKRLQFQPLIDLAYILVSIALGVFFWECVYSPITAHLGRRKEANQHQ